MVLVGQAVERADGPEHPEVLGARALDEHRDPAASSSATISPSAWAPVASSTWRSGRRRITTSDVGDRGELGEEPLGGTEEERAVEAVGDDVVAEEPSASVDWSTVMSSGSGSAIADVRACDRRAARGWRRRAMPSSTATMRSKAIVAAAVSTSTTASERVERSTARTLWTSTIRTAVTISTPASAASGISDDERPAEQHDERSSTTAWTIAARRGSGRRRGR